MSSQPIPSCHAVALPYPGRGHINPMLNLCRLLLRALPDAVVSFILTEEWLALLRTATATDNLPPNLTFHTIPNVLPSEIGRGKDFAGFLKATVTKMVAPVEHVLDWLPEPKPRVIVYDTYLSWAVGVGHRRNIPVASLYTMSATVFTTFYHSHLVAQNGHFSSGEKAKAKLNEEINYIPEVDGMKMGDLPTPFYNQGQESLPHCLEAIKLASNAQYLLFSSIYELESQVIDHIKQNVHAKTYSVGPLIPYFEIVTNHLNGGEKPQYLKWLDAQPHGSVLYISQGSFLSVSNAQLDEIIAGVCASGVRFLWVGRGEGSEINSENGIVVAWCDQLKVLCHPSVGGFWSHCGWNSTKEGAFAGVPIMAFPIFWDQVTNSMMIVEKWKTGVRVRKADETLVTREDITKLVLEVMSSSSDAAMERKIQAKENQSICKNACAKGGSAEVNILNFVQDICRH